MKLTDSTIVLIPADILNDEMQNRDIYYIRKRKFKRRK